MCFAGVGCGSASHSVGTTKVIAPPTYQVLDLNSASAVASNGGMLFRPSSISGSGLIFGDLTASVSSSSTQGSWLVVSSASGAQVAYDTAISASLYPLEPLLADDGLLAAGTAFPTTSGDAGTSTDIVVTAAGATASLLPIPDQRFLDTMASAVPTLVAGTVFLNGVGNENAEQAVLWSYESPTASGTSAQYSPVILPPLPGYLSTTATDINSAGIVVGASGTYVVINGENHATLWDPSRKPVDLGVPRGMIGSTAAAINDSNLVVGDYTGPAGGTSNPNSTGTTAGSVTSPNSYAFAWTAQSGMTALRALPADGTSDAVGVANSGVICGTSLAASIQSYADLHGVVWVGDIPYSLTSLVTGGWHINRVICANKTGQIVALATSSTGQSTYVVLTPN